MAGRRWSVPCAAPSLARAARVDGAYAGPKFADALRLPRLTAGHFVDNPASGRVLAKLGFRATGDTVRRYSAGRRTEASSRELVLEFAAAEPVAAQACAMAA